MIEFKNVMKRYQDGYEALHDVSFSMNRGEMAFLTGHSGAGKSTLLKLIMLMERTTKGQVVVGDQNLSTIHKRQIPYFRRHIGVVFQNHRLLHDRSIFDNVALPLEISGVSPREIGRRVRAALDKVGLLSKEKLSPIQLSGGEQQRVAVARALINNPDLIFADEPSGNLDSESAKNLHELFFKLRDEFGQTFVLVTHNEELANMADRKLTMKDGKMVEKS